MQARVSEEYRARQIHPLALSIPTSSRNCEARGIRETFVVDRPSSRFRKLREVHRRQAILSFSKIARTRLKKSVVTWLLRGRRKWTIKWLAIHHAGTESSRRINKIGDIEETSDRVWDSIIISNPRDFHNLLFSG